jgi:hypothetical protein
MTNDITNVEISATALKETATNLASYLMTNFDDGKFVYRVNVKKKIPQTTYNVLRHAGAIYSLAEYYKTQPSEELLNVITSAMNWLDENCNAKIYDSIIAVFSNRKITGKKEPDQAKLGGTALSLLSKVRIGQNCERISLSKMRKMANFLLFMQTKDGNFLSKFFPDKGGSSDWESLYYPGEAIFALSEYSQFVNEPTFFKAAVEGIRYLAAIREHDQNVPPDHWSLIATQSLMRNKDQINENMHFRIKIHARQIADSILGNFIFILNQRRTCQVATRAEGLLAYYKLCKELEVQYEDNLIPIIKMSIFFLITAVITSDPYCGGVTREFGVREVNERSNEIRIDYVQHALCAVLEYGRVFHGIF